MLKLPLMAHTVCLKSALCSLNYINNHMRKLMLIVPVLCLIGCAPAKCPVSSLPQEERYNAEEPTKYPDVPTMQAAEDAATGKLFKD